MSVSLSLAAALEKKGIKLVPSTTALKKGGGEWWGGWGRAMGGHARGRNRAQQLQSLRSGYIYLLCCPLGGYSLQGCSGPVNREKQAFRPNIAFKKRRGKKKRNLLFGVSWQSTSHVGQILLICITAPSCGTAFPFLFFA